MIGSTNSYDGELAFAKELADKAAEIAQEYYDQDPDFTAKKDNSPVTIADETINQMVIAEIKRAYPEHGVLGEEQSWQLGSKRLWVCDPLDATMSFMMRMPTFMFSIALVDEGEPVVAVTVNPVTQEKFWAVTGKGAYKNGKQIHASRRELHDAWLVFPTNADALVDAGILYKKLKQWTYMSDGIHGTVFKGMLIAQGSCDGSVWLGSVEPWDAAAVKLIVTEAGGKMTNIDDHEQLVDRKLTGGMVVSNSVIHQDLLDIIKRA